MVLSLQYCTWLLRSLNAAPWSQTLPKLVGHYTGGITEVPVSQVDGVVATSTEDSVPQTCGVPRCKRSLHRRGLRRKRIPPKTLVTQCKFCGKFGAPMSISFGGQSCTGECWSSIQSQKIYPPEFQLPC